MWYEDGSNLSRVTYHLKGHSVKFIHPHLRIYLPVTLFALLMGCLFLYTTSKVDSHLFVNSMNTAFLDFVFKYFTHFGGGTFVIVGSLVLSIIFWKRLDEIIQTNGHNIDFG